MAWTLEDLPWLPPAPPDFRDRCRALEGCPTAPGAAIAALAAHRLDHTQLVQLGRRIATLRAADRDLAPLVPLRLAVLGSATIEPLVQAMAGAAARHGIALEVAAAPYGQLMQAAMDPQGPAGMAAPDAVLLALDWRDLPFVARRDRPAAQEVADADPAAAFLADLMAALRRQSAATLMLQSLPPPPEPEFGSLDAVRDDGLQGQVRSFNARLAGLARQDGAVLLDAAHLAARFGLDRWHDPMRWNAHKLPFAPAAVPLYADQLGRLLGALRGRYRKCLVLDLDNTLWGGVIGDDGLSGIVLGQGSGMGEAFLAVQRAALDLKARGVVLAVCSKNDEAVAREPFRSHPDMLLREADIAVFRAGWGEKAEALQEIAAALNFSTDALVLLDDNPVERARVREVLPQVAVPELPEDPSFYARTLLSAGCFEAVGFSAEDRDRAAQYAANARRAELQAGSRDLRDFLASLDMALQLAPVDAVSRPRVAQLIAKSNQYNLTTRRYAEAELRALEARPDTLVWQARLRDRFGDNGIVSVVICRDTDRTEWQIDTWLMSCRVIGRGVENALRDALAEAARARGATALLGRFLPSGRNELVRDHYARLGFTAVADAGQGEGWRLDLAGHRAEALPMQVTGPEG